MAKDKDRAVNPAAAQRKAEKQKALKKGKAEVQARRNEKLSRRNPERIQRQIDDLKALESSGEIKAREKSILADLERDLKAVKKAREATGQTSLPQAPGESNTPSVLGKRRHDGQRTSHSHRHDRRRKESGSDTDDSVRAIPWPRDTPPPVPKEFRRSHHGGNTQNFGTRTYPGPEGTGSGGAAEVKTTYSSAPQIRNLQKEAIARFVPNVVKKKQDAVRGSGGQLLEPEELDRLEREGYTTQHTGTNASVGMSAVGTASRTEGLDEAEARRLREEEAQFERELAMEMDAGVDMDVAHREKEHNSKTDSLQQQSDIRRKAEQTTEERRHVQMEEVEDEDV